MSLQLSSCFCTCPCPYCVCCSVCLLLCCSALLVSTILNLLVCMSGPLRKRQCFRLYAASPWPLSHHVSSFAWCPIKVAAYGTRGPEAWNLVDGTKDCANTSKDRSDLGAGEGMNHARPPSCACAPSCIVRACSQIIVVCALASERVSVPHGMSTCRPCW